MLIFMVGFSDDELNRLRVENQNLAADLRQCQNDKDFVWSLWKKLQVANPDVSKAISLVVQREKEKAEIKDRKVLEVLQLKDDRIEELQTILSLKSRELGDVAIRRIDHQEDLNRLQREIEDLRDRNANLEMQFRMRGINMSPPRVNWKLRGLESRERSSGDLHRSTVESLSKDKHDMEQRLRKMTTELEIARAEKESTVAEKINLENKVRLLERDVNGSMVKFESIIGELEEAKRILQQYETKSQQLVKEIEFKNGELENVRKELSDLWHSHNQLTEHSSQQADLIRQLQSLQQDTQKNNYSPYNKIIRKVSHYKQTSSDNYSPYNKILRKVSQYKQTSSDNYSPYNKILRKVSQYKQTSSDNYSPYNKILRKVSRYKQTSSDNYSPYNKILRKVSQYKQTSSDNYSPYNKIIRKVSHYKQTSSDNYSPYNKILRKVSQYKQTSSDNYSPYNKILRKVSQYKQTSSDNYSPYNKILRRGSQYKQTSSDNYSPYNKILRKESQYKQTSSDNYSPYNKILRKMYKDLTSRYEVAKRGESDLRHELHELRKELIDKDSVISTLQMKVDNSYKRRRSRSPGTSGSFISEDQPFVDLEFKVKSMQREINLLRDTLEDKDRYIDKLERERDKLDIEFDVSGLNRRERTHSTPARELKSVALSPIKSAMKSEVTRSRSLSPVRKSREKRETNSLNFRQGDLRHKLIQSERKLEDTKNMLRLKNRELEELKKAHAKRYDRLKSIQTDYKILKDQVKLLEEDNNKTRGRKKKRSDPKDLRHEDSDKVWNELAFFKNENRGLIVDRMSLEEELDTLKVQTSENEATIHELKVALQQERENRQYDKKRSDFNTQEKSDLQSELTLMKSDLQSKMIRLEKVEKDIREVRAEKESVLDEKRLLKNEVMDLKQSEAKYRMEAANLKRDLNRLERELDNERLNRQIELSKEKHLASKLGKPTMRVRKLDHRSKTKAAKQYQKSLNRSIEKMRSVFKDFEDDGWEEVPESEEGDGTESDSLGQTIADLSQPDDSAEGTKRRLKPQSFKMSSVQRSRRAALRNLQHRHRNLMRSASNLKQTPGSSDQTKTVTVRETGTSMSPKKELSPPSKVQEQRLYEQRVQANNQILRQLKQSKQRLGYLQQHVTTMKDAKKLAVKSLNEQKETNQQLQNDLNLANQRLRLAKQNIQKLTSDLDKALQEKADLASQVMEENRHTTAQDKHTEQDWKILESRLKASSNEVCRQSGQVRQLKQDNDHLQEQIKGLHDKINRLERDNNQKRTLLEDQRMKLKLAQTNAKSEQNANEEMETRLKLVQDTCDRYKIQIDSFKKRLAAVTREKREYEEKFLKVNNELEKKNKLFMDSQTRSMELESAVGELEKTAQQQLRSLASQSEAAIEAAQDKLSTSFYTIQQYQHFVKTLGKELIKKINQSRIQLKDVQLQHEQLKMASETERSVSMQKAQAMAKDILNLSQSDLDEIMSADGDSDRLSMVWY
ncbi:hypothetical protein FSP39_005997 [Pinctada imbricata]|uniref:Centlein n=1 Tax=Pinctada imbricata TaxID=66713 RepID=A0AA88Y7T0_PINIB|nr:hypothetical protein FSP39_005997 [Pinctada imbricata]